MKNNYETKTNELKETMNSVTKNMLNKNEIYKVTEDLIKSFKPFISGDNMQMSFCSDLVPNQVPSDIRVRYIYVPTYIACGILMYAAIKYPEFMSEKEFSEILYDGLTGCTGRRFLGSGYDGTKGLLETMEIFAECKVNTFVDKYPEFNSNFTKVFNEVYYFIENEIISKKIVDGWSGQGYDDLGKSIIDEFNDSTDKINIFVYGTLMSGQSANSFMSEGKFKGAFLLNDYATYDIGCFPGIKKKKGEQVIGEVYEVSKSLLKELDRYEGEGSLYKRVRLKVIGENKNKCLAYGYVYNRSVSENDIVREKWGGTEQDYIWYAAYGSNLSSKRFLCYIQGGKCVENGNIYFGCTDKTMWKDEISMIADGELYFGNSSSSWGGYGVAFFDPSTYGKTYMKLYKITLSQFHDVQIQEGKSMNWYGKSVCLGFKDNLPIYTLTCKCRRRSNAPTDKYLKLITEGLNETEFNFSGDEIEEYLNSATIR